MSSVQTDFMHLARAARVLDAPLDGIHALAMLGPRLPERHGPAAGSLYTRTIELSRMVSASGERYAGEGHVFWTKSESASLETPSGAHLNCAGRSAETPWDEARLMGSDFRAIGQEPGWTLDLAEARGIRFVTADGTIRAFTPMPAPVGERAIRSDRKGPHR